MHIERHGSMLKTSVALGTLFTYLKIGVDGYASGKNGAL